MDDDWEYGYTNGWIWINEWMHSWMGEGVCGYMDGWIRVNSVWVRNVRGGLVSRWVNGWMGVLVYG